MILNWFRSSRDVSGRAEWDQPTSGRRKYKVDDLIGGSYRVHHVFEGGLGVVYVVEHSSGDRIVLKTLQGSPSQLDADFRQEAETWVRLGSHPNIVQAFWVDEVAGMPFVAAELVEPDESGRLSLRDYLKFGALTPTQITRWAAHFCYGLAHAESCGLISHRDIKPENLLIGRGGNLKITDFGISSAVPLTRATGSRHMGLGRWEAGGVPVSGTPPYMAPEQISGRKQDQRTDIYAFGVVLYEMAYGELPFACRTASDFFREHLNTEPRVPPGPFYNIIRRCLAKDPAMRNSGATELVLDFERIATARGIPFPPYPEPSSDRDDELRARAHSFGALGRIVEAIDSARELVARAPNDSAAWTQLGRLLMEYGDVDGAKDATKRSIALDATRSPSWNNLGVLLTREGKWQEAVEAFDHALECDPQNTGAMLNSARSLSKIGEIRDAVGRLRRASEIAPDKFSIWTNLGSIYASLRDSANALACLQKARDLAPPDYLNQIDELIRDVRRQGDGTSSERQNNSISQSHVIERDEKSR